MEHALHSGAQAPQSFIDASSVDVEFTGHYNVCMVKKHSLHTTVRYLFSLAIPLFLVLITLVPAKAFEVKYVHKQNLSGEPGGEASVSTRGKFNKADGTILMWFEVKPWWAASRTKRYLFSHDTGGGAPITTTPPYKFANMLAIGFSPGTLPTLAVWMTNSEGQLFELGVEADLSSGWHHLAVTWCRERGDVRLSVDGRETRATCLYWMEKMASKMTIGNWTVPAAENAAGGRISRFRIYGLPLEPAEIEEDFYRGKPEFQAQAEVYGEALPDDGTGSGPPDYRFSSLSVPSDSPVFDDSETIEEGFRWYVQHDGEQFRVKVPETWTEERDDPDFVVSFLASGKEDFPSEMNIGRRNFTSLPLFVPDKDVKEWALDLGKRYGCEVKVSPAAAAGYPAVGFELSTSVWGKRYKLIQIMFYRRRRTRYLLQGLFLRDSASTDMDLFKILQDSFQFRTP